MNLVITGGSGSLGKAILKQQGLLRNIGVTRIRVISRDEQKQVSLMRHYEGEIPLDCFLGDVADKERMQFALKDAHLVIHAAAQKHIDKFELDVPTGYKTNIEGTRNVSQAFADSKNAVSGIFVSTDKAALPITSYGISKLAAEHSWLWHNTYQKEIKFGVCRYGNIWASRGSVVETWSKKAKNKEAFLLTDIECTRFFMTMNEAACFVLRSLFENQKKVHIPEMKAARMLDIAEVIWEHHNLGLRLNYQVVGMRSIEKVHEILSAEGPVSNAVTQFTKDELRKMYEDWLNENHC